MKEFGCECFDLGLFANEVWFFFMRSRVILGVQVEVARFELLLACLKIDERGATMFEVE